jgi:hypothetical protein
VDGPAAGASGALFGLIGVLFVFGIKYRRELPEGFKRAFGLGLLPVILLNLVIGYVGSGLKIGGTTIEIGNAAHLGGLLSGALFALLIGYKRPGERSKVAVFWHVLQATALALVAVSFVMVALRYTGPAPSLSNINAQTVAGRSGGSDKLTGYLNAINGGQNTFLNALGNGDASGIDEAIKKLEEAEPPEQVSSQLRDELKTLLVRARDFLAETNNGTANTRARQRAHAQRQRELLEQFEAWVEKSNQWVKTEGEKYGISLQEPPPPPADKAPPEK